MRVPVACAIWRSKKIRRSITKLTRRTGAHFLRCPPFQDGQSLVLLPCRNEVDNASPHDEAAPTRLAPDLLCGLLSRRGESDRLRSEERRVGKECRSRWAREP